MTPNRPQKVSWLAIMGLATGIGPLPALALGVWHFDCFKVGNHPIMTIQKIFHSNQALSETQEKLFNLWGYRRHLSGVEKACIRHDGSSMWQLDLGNGVGVDAKLEYFEGDTPNQVFFRSVEGNLDVAGIIELTAIREDLTEVEVTIDAEFKSPIARVVDRMTDGLNRFLDCQLNGIRGYLAATHVKTAEHRGLALCP